jgi:hypothetical protein
MNRRDFLRLIGLGTASLAGIELIEPVRRFWQVPGYAPVASRGGIITLDDQHLDLRTFRQALERMYTDVRVHVDGSLLNVEATRADGSLFARPLDAVWAGHVEYAANHFADRIRRGCLTQHNRGNSIAPQPNELPRCLQSRP